MGLDQHKYLKQINKKLLMQYYLTQQHGFHYYKLRSTALCNKTVYILKDIGVHHQKVI